MAFKKEILEIIEPKDIFVGKTDATGHFNGVWRV